MYENIPSSSFYTNMWKYFPHNGNICPFSYKPYLPHSITSHPLIRPQNPHWARAVRSGGTWRCAATRGVCQQQHLVAIWRKRRRWGRGKLQLWLLAPLVLNRASRQLMNSFLIQLFDSVSNTRQNKSMNHPDVLSFFQSNLDWFIPNRKNIVSKVVIPCLFVLSVVGS